MNGSSLAVSSASSQTFFAIWLLFSASFAPLLMAVTLGCRSRKLMWLMFFSAAGATTMIRSFWFFRSPCSMILLTWSSPKLYPMMTRLAVLSMLCEKW